MLLKHDGARKLGLQLKALRGLPEASFQQIGNVCVQRHRRRAINCIPSRICSNFYLCVVFQWKLVITFQWWLVQIDVQHWIQKFPSSLWYAILLFHFGLMCLAKLAPAFFQKGHWIQGLALTSTFHYLLHHVWVPFIASASDYAEKHCHFVFQPLGGNLLAPIHPFFCD